MITRPDEYRHNNLSLAFIDDDNVRKGTSVASVANLYAYAEDKINEGGMIWVQDEQRHYTLTDDTNRGTSAGWGAVYSLSSHNHDDLYPRKAGTETISGTWTIANHPRLNAVNEFSGVNTFNAIHVIIKGDNTGTTNRSFVHYRDSAGAEVGYTGKALTSDDFFYVRGSLGSIKLSSIGSVVQVSKTTTQRDALTGVAGMFHYNSTNSKFEGYDGAWKNIATEDYVDAAIGTGINQGANTLTEAFSIDGNLDTWAATFSNLSSFSVINGDQIILSSLNTQFAGSAAYYSADFSGSYGDRSLVDRGYTLETFPEIAATEVITGAWVFNTLTVKNTGAGTNPVFTSNSTIQSLSLAGNFTASGFVQSNGNLICDGGFVSIEGTAGYIRSANVTTAPSAVAGAGSIYVEAGALKYVGSAGTITTIGPA